MTGSADSMRSPSRVTMTRRTPWVAGCCGPTLRVMSAVRSSWSALSWTMIPTPVPSADWNVVPPSCWSMLMLIDAPRRRRSLWLLRARPRLGLAGQQGELLAQRVADELLGEQQLARVRVALEL